MSYWPARVNCARCKESSWVVNGGVWTCIACNEPMTIKGIKVYHGKLDELAEDMAIQDDVVWADLTNKQKSDYYDRAREAMEE